MRVINEIVYRVRYRRKDDGIILPSLELVDSGHLDIIESCIGQQLTYKCHLVFIWSNNADVLEIFVDFPNSRHYLFPLPAILQTKSVITDNRPDYRYRWCPDNFVRHDK